MPLSTFASSASNAPLSLSTCINRSGADASFDTGAVVISYCSPATTMNRETSTSPPPNVRSIVNPAPTGRSEALLNSSSSSKASRPDATASASATPSLLSSGSISSAMKSASLSRVRSASSGKASLESPTPSPSVSRHSVGSLSNASS